MKRMLIPLLFVAALLEATCGAQAQKARPAAVAGSFYPSGPKELASMVDGLLAKAKTPEIRDLVALVSPHAGLVYSGGVAAHAYALLKGRPVERVVVIAPSHIESFGFTSVYDGVAYQTPLGDVPVDQAFASKLTLSSRLIQLSGRGHTPAGGRAEHAIEVQLPFLQRVLGRFRLVPIVMGRHDYEACRALGVALAKNIEGTGTIIVASSDLSHYHPYAEAVRLDRKTLNAITEWDYVSMVRNFERGAWEACGGGPIVAAMIAAERLGANEAKVLHYANSGDTSGDRSQVVGYGAVAFYRGGAKQETAAPVPPIGQAEKAELFRIAHESVEAAVMRKKLPEYDKSRYPVLDEERGVFVTLRINGQLRGCVGYPAPVKPLALAVREVAAAAAVEDGRFEPVSAKELRRLEYEISVLSPLRRVRDIKEIQIGRDGLLVKQGRYEGLLLPQVAVEQGWDRRQFVEETCQKAGLSPNAWKDEQTDIFRFTALVFEEHASAPPAPAQSRPQP